MNKQTYQYLHEHFGIEEAVLAAVEAAESKLQPVFARLDDIRSFNQYKVLDRFQRARINDQHFAWNTGYGYDDVGRAALEQLFADVFGAEAGLVRPTIVNGTHALASVYLGLLRAGDELIYCNGDPYDTMQTVIGLKGNAYGNLREFGAVYKQVDLLPGGKVDIEGVKRAIGPKTKICAPSSSPASVTQRSSSSWGRNSPALTMGPATSCGKNAT